MSSIPSSIGPLCRLAVCVLCASLPMPARGEDIEHNLEALIGRVAAELMARELGTFDNPLLTEWVDGVGARVAEPCPRQEFPFRFRILDTPEANAYALPGAHIFVTRGLLAQVRSDDELAGVLAHEVGHVADRDFQRTITRQLMFLGLREGLQRADQDSLTPALYIVQLLNSLRHSRRQEDQADLRGVEYALAARYDPTALTAFFDTVLRGRDEPREWYQGILEMHPDAFKRRERTVERVRRLGSADPEALRAVAEDLAARHRYSAALSIDGLRQSVSPEDAQPLTGSARIHLIRGEREACLSACRHALLIAPGDPAVLALAAEAERLEAPPAPPQPAAKRRAAAPPDWADLQRLKRLSRMLKGDRQFNDVLTWAQAYRPEADDWRWVHLVVKAQILLQVADRLRWRVTEITGLAGAGITAWASPEAVQDDEAADRANAAYTQAVKQGIEAAEDLRTAMQLLPTVLTSLAFSGNGDPFGRMSSTRVALLEADLLAVENRLKAALEHTRSGARDVALAEIERHTCALDNMAEPAGARQQAIYRGLAAARLRLRADEVGTALAQERPLGSACQAAALERAGVEPGAEPTYEQAEAVRVVLRLLTREAKAETIPTAPADAGAD